MAYFILTAAILAADQISKYLVRTNMNVAESIDVLGSFFQFTYFQNYGAAFNSFGHERVFLITVPAVAICVALVYFFRNRDKSPVLKTALSLIISGGTGNLIDRCVFVYVTDMFDFSIFPAIFNVADIAVVFGCALIVYYILFGEKIEEKRLRGDN